MSLGPGSTTAPPTRRGRLGQVADHRVDRHRGHVAPQLVRLCTSTWPGTSAVARPGSPSPVDVVAACPMNPSQTSDAVGTPARSATALARNTAGVQLPQQAMPEMTASTWWRRQHARAARRAPCPRGGRGSSRRCRSGRSERRGSDGPAPPRGSGRSRRRGRDRPRAGRWSCPRGWRAAAPRCSPAPCALRAATPPDRSRVRPIRSCVHLPSPALRCREHSTARRLTLDTLTGHRGGDIVRA